MTMMTVDYIISDSIFNNSIRQKAVISFFRFLKKC